MRFRPQGAGPLRRPSLFPTDSQAYLRLRRRPQPHRELADRPASSWRTRTFRGVRGAVPWGVRNCLTRSQARVFASPQSGSGMRGPPLAATLPVHHELQQRHAVRALPPSYATSGDDKFKAGGAATSRRSLPPPATPSSPTGCSPSPRALSSRGLGWGSVTRLGRLGWGHPPAPHHDDSVGDTHQLRTTTVAPAEWVSHAEPPTSSAPRRLRPRSGCPSPRHHDGCPRGVGVPRRGSGRRSPSRCRSGNSLWDLAPNTSTTALIPSIRSWVALEDATRTRAAAPGRYPLQMPWRRREYPKHAKTR